MGAAASLHPALTLGGSGGGNQPPPLFFVAKAKPVGINGEFAKTCQLFLAIALALILAAVGIWDAIVVWNGRGDRTVTAIIQDWAQRSPMLVLGIGAIIGHLFWPSHLN